LRHNRDRPNQEREIPMSNFSLDVVFNSVTAPLSTEGPIYAMGFGFAESPSGTWEEDGQQVEVVPDGANFYFSIFDTAPNSQASVTEIDVTFFDPDNPAVIWPYPPLSDPKSTTALKNPLVVLIPTNSVISGSSPGCNVANAVVWRIGPYVVTLPEKIPTLTLDCTVLIKLLANQSDPGSKKSFSVDPEVQVEGGG
jgi:hypothetical protein